MEGETDFLGNPVETPAVDGTSVTSDPPAEPPAEPAPGGEGAQEPAAPEGGAEPPASTTAQPAQTEGGAPAAGKEPPPAKKEDPWFLVSKFRTADDMKKNWFEQAKHIGGLGKKIKALEAKLKEYDISLDSGDNELMQKTEAALAEKMKPTLDYINNVRINQIKDSVAEAYPGFDLDANGDKVLAELKFFSDSMRVSDPEGCVKRAVANILSSDEALASTVRENAKKKQMAATVGTGPAPAAQPGQPGEVDPMDEIVEFAGGHNQLFPENQQ